MAIKVLQDKVDATTPEQEFAGEQLNSLLEAQRKLIQQTSPVISIPYNMEPPKGIEHSPYMNTLKILFGRSARMGSSAGQTITSTPIWPGNSKPYGYNKQQAEIAVQSTKVVSVRREWLRWPTVSKHDNLKRHVMGCCVCKTKTPANMPWWKPFRIMKVVGLLKKDFPYKDIYSTSRLDEGNLSYDKRDYYFAVCSEGCENFVYLALLDI